MSDRRTVKYWEIIADNLSKAGWSWGCVSAIDSRGRTIWIADAHRDNGKRFVVRADEKAGCVLESGIRPKSDRSIRIIASSQYTDEKVVDRSVHSR